MGEKSGGSVHHPKHYNAHESGVECIDIIEHLPGNLCNAVKYAWRKDHKRDVLEDLKKCLWYLERERARDFVHGMMVPLHVLVLIDRVRGQYAIRDSDVLGVVLGCVGVALRSAAPELNIASYRNALEPAIAWVKLEVEYRNCVRGKCDIGCHEFHDPSKR